MESQELNKLIGHLRGMRHGLARYDSGDLSRWPDASQRRAVLLDRYDARLREAADAVGVAPPSDTGPARGRQELEDALADAGIDLRGNDEPVRIHVVIDLTDRADVTEREPTRLR